MAPEADNTLAGNPVASAVEAARHQIAVGARVARVLLSGSLLRNFCSANQPGIRMTLDEPARRPMAPGQFLFALTVVLSAFLLFQVQPLLAKFILPWFGGSPAVWTAAMLFFQMTLFAGYAYAHAIVRFLPTKAQVATHIIVLIVACCLLPIIPSEAWKGHTAPNPTWTICGLLATAVGLPYFSLSATGPLLQAWYYKWRADGSPYRLYALSNAGSLAGLLTYPLIVEPNWRLKVQANSWSLGFGVFAGCCALTGLLVGRAAKSPNTVAYLAQSVTSATAISWRRRLSWLGLSMLGSSLLLATTNHVCQDVAVVPFLWVIPLTLYLLTFIVCFDRPAWYSRKWIPAVTVAWILATVSPDVVNDMLQETLGLTFTGFNLVSLAGFSFIAMFLGCMVSHGELRRLAPPPEKLTEFYLFMSAGGALGGMFVSLLAPVVFQDFYEWPLTLGICVLVSLHAVWQEFRPVEPEGRAPWLVRTFIACGLGSLVLYQIVRSEIPSTPPLSFQRNFYGVVIVREPEVEAGEDPYRVIVN
ncbi:MAG TPA: hypothetical protein VM510_16500, partial [Caulifigura sp.]|nr:hypothetical protein [Caulifigura sp.]